jgi:hypothetical protein
MKNLSLLLLAFTLIVFTGCSQKKYYEPEESFSVTIDEYDTGAEIIDFHSNGATLSNSKFVTKKGISSVTLEEDFRFLTQDGDTVLSTNDQGVLAITKAGRTEKIQFDKNIVAASTDRGLIGFLMIDNSIALYDLKERKTVFKSYFNISILNDIRIASPIFLNTLVLFPTLDGKVVIVDKLRKSVYKTINLDPKSDVKNITYLKAMGSTLIAATNNKLFSFVNGVVKTISEDIRSVASNTESIFVATLDGRIVKYDHLLNKQGELKFQYANFYALAYGDDLYALESQDYLIKVDNDLKNFEVYDFSFDEEDKVFAIDDTIYFEDSYIVLK